VQATAAGLAIAIGAFARDAISAAAVANKLGPTLAGPVTGYVAVYSVEIFLLLGTLVALGPLVRGGSSVQIPSAPARFGLREFPT
jgi:BCD family chlorophyll transporter-like MFS transporter